jgi:hypothetical protein
MIITTYKIDGLDEEDYEDLLNKLFIGLEHYKKKMPGMRFKIRYDGKTIELTTIKQDAESLN